MNSLKIYVGFMVFVVSCNAGKVLDNDIIFLQEEVSNLNSLVKKLLPASCKQAQELGNSESGIYNLKIGNGSQIIQVYCDMKTDGGGWTVFQRRFNGEQEFYLGWDKYVQGFGNRNREFWMGLSNINSFTGDGNHELRIELKDCSNRVTYAKYGVFNVAGPTTNYRLSVGNYTGNATGDSMAYQNGEAFSTYDRDHDSHAGIYNCAIQWHGAWWYRGCHHSNPNGAYSPCEHSPRTMTWKNQATAYYTGYRSMEMKFRPRI